ncbi:hypothetical protein FRX31_025698 [Thalictrum thalictroides]|uniref:Uncharacterized protein n=1 Tax=Thalictrum thalictroides TaxID=46969 RepID=A0A7J6VIY5_THATH|nr:hypothetical protein FRX31_025698 [Thalictrum thalictroides]
MEDPYDFITKDALIPESQQKILDTCPFIHENSYSNKESPFSDNFRRVDLAGIISNSRSSKEKHSQTTPQDQLSSQQHHHKKKNHRSDDDVEILGSKKKTTDRVGNSSSVAFVDLTQDSDGMDIDEPQLPEEVKELIRMRDRDGYPRS